MIDTEKQIAQDICKSVGIVQLWHGHFIGSDCEEWYPPTGTTVVTAHQYKSYTDGTIETLTDTPEPYTMGIASCGVQNEEWKVVIIKSHKDIIPGERFKSYGINFK